ncbi:hypothetical protein [Conyzicola nivalis]
MPDLRSELLADVRAPLEFALITPPGWARFGVDEAAEKQLAGNMEQVFRDRGQPKQLFHQRAQLHKLFNELRRRNAVAVYLPVKPVNDVVLPVSIAILPAPVRDSAGVDRFAQRLASRGAVSSGLHNGLQILRWEERNAVPGENGAHSLAINHLFEAPTGSGRSAALVTASLLYIDGSEGEEFTESLEILLEAIVGTFTWRITS